MTFKNTPADCIGCPLEGTIIEVLKIIRIIYFGTNMIVTRQMFNSMDCPLPPEADK